MTDGRGWYGDRDGHRDARLKADEHWLQTRWRHLREAVARSLPWGE